MTLSGHIRDRRSFVDSAGYYALADRGDANHTTAAALLAALRLQRFRLVTTNFVLAESHALVLNRLGYAPALRLLTDITTSPATTLVRVTRADEDRARVIIRRYADKRFSYTDATSFAVMERLRLTQVFSFDRDFAQYGFTLLALLDQRRR
ncbi:MAG: type II toxin-antitoxin system VapC family toxin [Dehalococcoidia bacterium]